MKFEGCALASAFKTSKTLSLATTPNLSISGPRLSKLHTDTLLLVTLWYALSTFHRPTGNEGVTAAGTTFSPREPKPEPEAVDDDDENPGVVGRLELEG